MISVCKENLSIEISVHEMSHRLTAYAEVNPTVAIIVMSTCSFTVNGPGFRDMPKNFTLGISLAHNRPTGNDNSWATIWVPIQSGGMRLEERLRTPVTVMEGYRKKKNWFIPGSIIAQARPMHHARIVLTGMSGSSVFATAERTSGYGESSSVEKKSDFRSTSILKPLRERECHGRSKVPSVRCAAVEQSKVHRCASRPEYVLRRAICEAQCFQPQRRTF